MSEDFKPLFKAHIVPAKAPAIRPLKKSGRNVSLAEVDAALSGAKDEALEASKEGRPKEIGGPKGPEPTRYGDWEVGGIASDF